MLATPRLLLVSADDNERASLAKRLEDRGYHVTTVADGKTALHSLINNESPDGIILIGSIGCLGGWELLTIARSYRRLSQVAALLVTQEPVGPMDRNRLHYLAAPASDEAFLDAVAQMLSQSRTRAA